MLESFQAYLIAVGSDSCPFVANKNSDYENEGEHVKGYLQLSGGAKLVPFNWPELAKLLELMALENYDCNFWFSRSDRFNEYPIKKTQT